MLKRAGRGHDPAGVNTTREGECAVLCPACPQPGKNLPEDWRQVPKLKGYVISLLVTGGVSDVVAYYRWLYALFLAIDANFRLKRKIVSKDATDPSLSRGWAYFVDDKSYHEHLAAHGKDVQEVRSAIIVAIMFCLHNSIPQKSTCASHNAVNMAETKSSDGLAATGLGTVDCARHNMKLPNGVSDLQKGERYVFIFEPWYLMLIFYSDILIWISCFFPPSVSAALTLSISHMILHANGTNIYGQGCPSYPLIIIRTMFPSLSVFLCQSSISLRISQSVRQLIPSTGHDGLVAQMGKLRSVAGQI